MPPGVPRFTPCQTPVPGSGWLAPMRAGPVEITDLLWPLDQAGFRMPVMRQTAVAELEQRKQHRAARIVRRMPEHAGEIDRAYLDALALRIHCELQRLGEELQLDRRVAALLLPHVNRLMGLDHAPVRIIDVGCGLGHVLRAAAAHGHLPDGVELVGVDLNPTLIAEAQRLTQVERLCCDFIAGDAFTPGVAIADPGRTIVISTGLLHHLEPSELVDLFAAQAALGVAGFAHWDIAPCFWSTLGAWMFHQARMREPISQHDGVMSARRAHSAEVLLRSAIAGAPEYAPTVLERPRWYPRALDVLRPITGWRA